MTQASSVQPVDRTSRAMRATGPAMNAMGAVAARHSAQRGAPAVLDIGSIARAVMRRMPSIILSTIATLGLGMAYLAVTQPKFTATSAIFLDPRQRRVVAEDVVQSSGGADIALFESQVSIIGSDTILRRVVVAEGLLQDEEFVPPRRESVTGKLRDLVLGPRERPQADPMLQALERLAKALRVRRAQNTYVVNVDVTTGQAVKSARIANAVLKAYLDDQAAAKVEAVAKANALIDGRLDELKAQVREAELRVDTFKRENRLVTSEGGMLNEQQLTKLNAELVVVRTQVAATKAKLDEMQDTLRRGVSPEALPEAMTSPVIQRLREQLAAATRREAALGAQMQARHPVMADARAQVEALKGQISAELKRIAMQTQNEYQVTAGREREIVATLRSVESEVVSTTTAQIKLRELEREADASREILRAFLARQKETQEQQNLQIADARVITPAAVPSRSSSPNVPLVLAFSALSGLALSVLRALLGADLARGGTTGPRLSLEGRAGPLRAVGTLPLLTSPGGRFGRRRGAVRGPLEFLQSLSEGQGAGDVAFRSAVQQVAGRLRALDHDGKKQVLLFVSSQRGVGTSTAALAVAHVRASGGEKVLLIDAASADPALSMHLAGDLVQDKPCVLDSKEDLLALSSRDAASGLVLLPIALADLNQLSGSQRMRLAAGIDKVAAEFDVVVIDGGALPEDPGAIALVNAVTAVVYVARSGHYDAAEAEDVLAMLGIERGRVAGVLETMTASKSGA